MLDKRRETPRSQFGLASGTFRVSCPRHALPPAPGFQWPPQPDQTQPVEEWVAVGDGRCGMGNRVIALAQLIIPHRKINLLLCTHTFMAHCGRLNVCANQLGKCDIFEWPFSTGSPSPSVSMYVYFLRLRYDQSINWTTTTTSMTLFSGDNVVSSLAALDLFWHKDCCKAHNAIRWSDSDEDCKPQRLLQFVRFLFHFCSFHAFLSSVMIYRSLFNYSATLLRLC